MRTLLIPVIVTLAFACSPERSSRLFSEDPAVDRVLHQGQKNILDRQLEGNHWRLPAYMGTHLISQYYLMSRLLGVESAKLDPERLKNILLTTQNDNGSWTPTKNDDSRGTLAASIYNYMALKTMGLDVSSESLGKARQYILSQGGIQAAPLLEKFHLALFGEYPWHQLPPIPIGILGAWWSPLTEDSVAQWMAPYIRALSYLRYLHVQKSLGPEFSVKELWVGNRPPMGAPFSAATRRTMLARASVGKLITSLLKTQQPRGSWGGYTVLSMLTVVALQDFAKSEAVHRARIQEAMSRALRFCDEMYFESGESAYLGVMSDGRYWDTILLARALMLSGHNPQGLTSVGDYLVANQMTNGGMPFGIEFEHAPDNDDTAELVLALHAWGDRYQANQDKAIQYMIGMQNRDGGWGAFSRNNTGNVLTRLLTQPFVESGDVFDESTPDLTGHVLEALGAAGFTIENSRAVQNGIAYLRRNQDRTTGAWPARWGVNYLYGTNAALMGMLKTGVEADDPVITRGLSWLASKQNHDGGFGESVESYINADFAGVGPSTPSQTSWAMMPLIAAGRGHTPTVRAAVEYLVKEIESKGAWHDEAAVGTALPGIAYFYYPSYSHAWPLMALGQYRRSNR